ncbi:hypothetical protein [Roseobacter sinensis]|uniref:NarX-like N-terminal domain-containing protein n=1 Tax=Roseobacter sinensis TaxID=2931391 RepID=A0ABT3BC87_9RHOB|nr:hypothetical protein [Roseobacter sp. WL0113]MCV3271160.1 hypothetical protein [Roseobacter sp. WL0113]
MRYLVYPVQLTAICLLLLGSGAAFADAQAQHADALARIKAAAHQRALFQTMAKSTCFLMAGVAPQLQAEQAFIASMMFDDNAAALRSGQGEGIAGPESDPVILAGLDGIDTQWATFAPASRQVMSGDFHAIPVQQLIRLDPVVSSNLEALVEQVAETYRTRLVTRQEMVRTISQAAGQSMLVRKAAKALCYIGIDLSQARMRDELAHAIDRFETILTAMEFGDFDLEIVDPPTLAAIKQVMEMKDVWTRLRPLLERGLGDQPVGRETLTEVAALTDEMAGLTDGMVALYLEQ